MAANMSAKYVIFNNFYVFNRFLRIFFMDISEIGRIHYKWCKNIISHLINFKNDFIRLYTSFSTYVCNTNSVNFYNKSKNLGLLPRFSGSAFHTSSSSSSSSSITGSLIILSQLPSWQCPHALVHSSPCFLHIHRRVMHPSKQLQ